MDERGRCGRCCAGDGQRLQQLAEELDPLVEHELAGRLPTQPDPLHERHGLCAAVQLEPLQHRQHGHRHAGPGLRAPVPLRPDPQQVRSVAGHQRHLERGHLHDPGSQRREVEQRDAADRRGRRLLDQPGQDQQVRSVRLQRGDRDQRDRERQHRDGQVHQLAGLHRVAGLPLEGPGRATGRLVQAVRGQPDHRGQQEPGGHRAHAARHLQLHRGGVQGQPELVGHQAARPVVQVQVPGRRRQRLQQRRAVRADRRAGRLEQQFPARHQRAGQRAERQRRVRLQDVLPELAVHAVGQHGLAGAEHDQGADEQRQLPQGAGLRDQPEADRQRGLRRDHPAGRPNRAAAQPEFVHQPQRGQPSTGSATTRRWPSSTWRSRATAARPSPWRSPTDTPTGWRASR